MLDVVLSGKINEDAVAAGRARITRSLDRGVEKGKLTQEERDAALGPLTVTADLGGLADRDLVIETATENPGVKAALFADIDATVKRPDEVSSRPTPPRSPIVLRSARATSRPRQVIGLHFFNLATVQEAGRGHP